MICFVRWFISCLIGGLRLDDVEFHVGFQALDASVGEDVLRHVEWFFLRNDDHVDVFRTTDDGAVGVPIDAFVVVAQLIP